jgi:Helix-turn-helix domain of resolvase
MQARPSRARPAEFADSASASCRVSAEFETNLRRERQIEGIAKAKAAGIYKARPASIDAARVRELKAQGLGPTEIAKALKIGRASVYRILEDRESTATSPRAGCEVAAGRKYYKRDGVRTSPLTIVLRLTVQERALLQNEADARGYGVTGPTRMLIERVLQDDLVKAILDD